MTSFLGLHSVSVENSVSFLMIQCCYLAGVINYAQENCIGFVVRAKMDASLKNSISAIKELDYKSLQHCNEVLP